MRILLDTHIALWAVADSGKLSEEVKQKRMKYTTVSPLFGKLQLSII